MISIPYRLRKDVRPGLQSLEAGYNKSRRLPGLSFPSSYRDSTFLSIFAVPNNAVFWITSNLTFTPILFMYSLKLKRIGVNVIQQAALLGTAKILKEVLALLLLFIIYYLFFLITYFIDNILTIKIVFTINSL